MLSPKAAKKVFVPSDGLGRQLYAIGYRWPELTVVERDEQLLQFSLHDLNLFLVLWRKRLCRELDAEVRITHDADEEDLPQDYLAVRPRWEALQESKAVKKFLTENPGAWLNAGQLDQDLAR